MKNFMQMFTSLRRVNLVGRTGLAKMGLLVLASLLAGTAWAQPANDYFTNAIVISGLDGTINGITNTGATMEPCESNTVPTDDHGLVDVDNSVWYVWTATAT